MSLFLPGAVLRQRYQITRLLKAGGMGQLFLAQDLKHKQVVVVKVTMQTDRAGHNQFRREAGLLKPLRHPNLPRVFDYIEEEGRHCLIMEYIPGYDLAEWLSLYGAATEAQVLGWIDQVLDALTYLHQQQPSILHRDIKPANIKLLEDRQTVKLVDFGIARTWYSSHDLMTHSGARAVSPPYSPWEQYGQGTGPYSDIYALGATMYHLLSGRLPPEGIARSMEQDKLVPLRQLAPHVSKNTEKVVQRAMALRQEERWQTPWEMRQSMRQGTFSTLITPQPAVKMPGTMASASRRPRTGGSNMNLLWAGGAAILVLVVVLLMATTDEQRTSSSPRPPTPAPTESPTTAPIVAAGVVTPAATLTPTATSTLTTDATPTDAAAGAATPTKQPTTTTISPVASPSVTTTSAAPILLAPKSLEEENTTHITNQQIEFRWSWPGGQLPDGLGFEIKVWVQGKEPKGIYDAKEMRKGLALAGPGKDEYSFAYAGLGDAPGVREGGTSDQYLWSVSLVQLEPYQVLAESEHRPINIAYPGKGGPDGGDGSKVE